MKKSDTESEETYTLFESDDMVERIIVNRNSTLNTEYILLSPSLVHTCESSNPLGSNIVFPDQYQIINMFRRKVERYQNDKESLERFIKFFGVSITDFFAKYGVDNR